MRDEVYMVCSPTGVRKCVKKVPHLQPDEIVIKVNVVVPDSHWDRHIPERTLEVPEDYTNHDTGIGVSLPEEGPAPRPRRLLDVDVRALPSSRSSATPHDDDDAPF